MAKPVDLDQLAIAIRDLESRLRAVKAGYEATEKEIATLNILESTLIENIAVLKHKDVITVAHEFRKAILDLSKARHRLVFLRINRETYSKAKTDQEDLIKHLKNDYEKAFSEQSNNVIKVDFGSKDGR